MNNKPDWMNEEEGRAEDLVISGETNNDDAPKMVKVKRAPSRKQKPFYIQDKYARAFELLVFNQNQIKGKRAPELAEEALDYLFNKYDIKL
jgi:hypothetical protein